MVGRITMGVSQHVFHTKVVASNYDFQHRYKLLRLIFRKVLLLRNSEDEKLVSVMSILAAFFKYMRFCMCLSASKEFLVAYNKIKINVLPLLQRKLYLTTPEEVSKMALPKFFL